MKIVAEGWNVVVVGAWNVAILNPEWLGRNLFKDSNVQVEIPIGGQPVALMRVTSAGVRVLTAPDRVIFSPVKIDDGSLRRVEECAVDLLRQLPHTPLVAIGVNFKFVEADPGEHLVTHFRDPDVDAIVRLGFVSEGVSQTRHLRFADDRTLNLKTRLAGNRLELDFNFHRDVKTVDDAMNAVGGRIIDFRDRALGLLAGVFGLEVEQESEVGSG
jgi:hypothetical protein